MPPVLGPWSPSKMRLWSWDDASGRKSSPSIKAMNEASSPMSSSSMTTRSPATPKIFRPMMPSRAASASNLPEHRITPLPAANPSALTTHGWSRPTYRLRLVEVREDLAGRGGDAVLQHQFLGERLAALKPGRVTVGSEHLEAPALEQVADPQHQRLLRAHHGKVDGLPGGEIGQLLDLAGGDVHGLSLLADAGAAGGAVELVHPGDSGSASTPAHAPARRCR